MKREKLLIILLVVLLLASLALGVVCWAIDRQGSNPRAQGIQRAAAVVFVGSATPLALRVAMKNRDVHYRHRFRTMTGKKKK